MKRFYNPNPKFQLFFRGNRNIKEQRIHDKIKKPSLSTSSSVMEKESLMNYLWNSEDSMDRKIWIQLSDVDLSLYGDDNNTNWVTLFFCLDYIKFNSKKNRIISSQLPPAVVVVHQGASYNPNLRAHEVSLLVEGLIL